MGNARIRLTTPISGFLDIKGDSAFPINFSVGDIRDISKRNGSYSKTITIVGNKESNKILGHLYDVNISQETFNINVLQECLVEQDGIVILDNMYLQLTRVYKVQKPGSHDYDVEYEAEIRDSSADFFSKIGNLELKDLDFSEFNDHNYTVASVTASFANTYVDGYKYLLPWKNPYNTLGNAHLKYGLKEMRPAIYARQYWDKIFDAAGYTYTFDEKDNFDIQFDKLIIPYNGEDVKVEDNFDLNVEASNSTTLSKYVWAGVLSQDAFRSTASPVNTNAPSYIILDNEISDANNQYNPTTGTFVPAFTVTNPAVVKFNVFVEYEILVNFTTNVTLSPIYAGALNGGNIVKSAFILRNLNTTNEVSQYFDDVYIPGNTSYSSGTHSLTTDSIGFELSLTDLTTSTQIKEKLYLAVQDNSNNSGNNWVWKNSGGIVQYAKYTINITNITMEIKPTNLSLDYNVPVTINSFIPKKIKQSDFIKSICQMYNLYVDVDDDNRTNLIIKTRDKFYDDGSVVNWTKKFAKDKPHDIKFLPELSNKKLILTYKQDTDVANKGYFDNVNEIYGQIEYVFENEYVKGSDKKELIFSPTPNDVTAFNANTPLIDGFTPKNNIRILLDNGEVSCSTYYIKDLTDKAVTSYPFLSHFNDALNPTFDINYGMCDYYFYNPTTTTDNNLYNLHWRRTLGQINNGKLLTGYFNLNAIDIQKMELSHKVRIDNSYWNINKIIDYNANSNALTKVELISIDDELELPDIKTKTIVRPNKGDKPLNDVIVSGPIGGGPASPVGGGGVSPVGPSKGGPNVILSPVSNVKGTRNFVSGGGIADVNGNDNIISTDGISTINGDWNKIYSPSNVWGSSNSVDYNLRNATIYGSNNTIEGGADNSFIIGDGITATRNNTLYSNNIEIVDGDISVGPMILGTQGVSFNRGYFDEGYIDGGYVGASASDSGMFWTYDDTLDETTVDFVVDNFLINGVDITSLISGSGATGPTGPAGSNGATGATGPAGSSVMSVGTYSISSTIGYDINLIYTSVGSLTMTLPTAIGADGKIYTIKDRSGMANTNNIIVIGTASQTIDGTASYTMRLNYESVSIVSDGGSWFLI